MEVDQPDGTNATVVSTAYEAHPAGITVYNFEVEGDHTYFVEDGQGRKTALWVHNRCGGAKKLFRNMVNAGWTVAQKAGKQIHHIVARNESRWKEAINVRDHFYKIFNGTKDTLDEFFNGVALRAGYHVTLNCRAYYTAVWKRIKNKNTPLDLMVELMKIADELKAETFIF